MFKCKCLKIRYCSRVCQKQDRDRHQPDCENKNENTAKSTKKESAATMVVEALEPCPVCCCELKNKTQDEKRDHVNACLENEDTSKSAKKESAATETTVVVKALEPCPVCCCELRNKTQDEKSDHVNACLDSADGSEGVESQEVSLTESLLQSLSVRAEQMAAGTLNETHRKMCSSCDQETDCIECFRCERSNCCWDCQSREQLLAGCELCGTWVCRSCDNGCSGRCTDPNCRWVVSCPNPTCQIQLCADCRKQHRLTCKEVPKTKATKPKPNAKCPCGSGKKFKKCCRKYNR